MKKNKADDFLKLARDRFSESESAESENRELSIRDKEFENGDQWTEDEQTERAGRPCMVDNRVAGAVKQIVGDSRMNRPRIKVRPVDSGSDPIIAEIMTGLIRHIENISDAEAAYDTGHENSVRGAIGYWRIKTDYSDDDTFEQDILIERIVNPEAVYFDQGGIKPTYEDAEYCFVSDTIRKEKFKKTWPKATVTDWDQAGEGVSESGWFAEETVRIAEYWYKEPYTKHIFLLQDGKTIEIEHPEILADEGGQGVVQDEEGRQFIFTKHRESECQRVMQSIISGAEILSGPHKWPGKYIPIVPCLGEEIWINGKRILRSAIRHAIDPQRVHNWNVSNDIETKALSPKQPWLLTPEQIDGFQEMWDSAYVTPRPYLLYNQEQGQNPPQRLTGSVSDNGAVQGIALSIDSIKAATGIYDASLGNRSNETSGIAIERRQRQGSLATYVFVDNQTRAIKYTGKILVDLIPKIYDSDRIVRILGDDLQKKFQNQMGPQGEPLVQVGPGGTDAMVRINFKNAYDGKIYNDMSIGKYDIVVDAGPGYLTRRQEAADGMIKLVQSFPQSMPVLLPRIAKNSDWPDMDEIGDELKQIMTPQPQGPSPKDQLAIEKGKQDLQKGSIDIEGKRLDLAGKAQDIQSKQMNEDQRIAAISQQMVLGTLRQLGFNI